MRFPYWFSCFLLLISIGLSTSALASERWVIQFKKDSQVTKTLRQNPAHSDHVLALTKELNKLASLYKRPISLIRPFGAQGAVVHVPSDSDPEQTRLRLLSDPSIESVEIDRRIRLHAQSPLVGILNELDLSRRTRTWFHQEVSAQPASINTGAMWTNFHGTAPTVIAVLDTGVLPSHRMLQGRLLPGYDFVSDSLIATDGQRSGGSERDPDPTDPGDGVNATDLLLDPACAGLSNSSWHGTFVSGLLAGNSEPSEGVLSINWNAAIVPVRVLGKCGGFSSDLADGIRWAAGLSVPGAPANPFPARIINLSLGAQGSCVSAIEGAAVAAAREAGALVVVAAGNDGAAVDSPANCPGAFAVAGLDQEGLKASYSNFGGTIQLVAPGGDVAFPIWSASNTGLYGPLTNTYATKVGTSFSAPMVAAAASLYLSLNPGASVQTVESALKATARPFIMRSNRAMCSPSSMFVACNCTSGTCGAGMLDIARLINTLSSGGFSNLFAESGNVISPGGSKRFFATGSTSPSGQAVSAVSFEIINIQKSSGSVPNPVLSVSGLLADVTAPVGVTGFDLKSTVANGRSSVVSVTVANSGATSPTLLAGLLSPLLGAVSSETLGVPATSPGEAAVGDSDAPSANAGSGGGGGGGGAVNSHSIFGLFALFVLLRFQNRKKTSLG